MKRNLIVLTLLLICILVILPALSSADTSNLRFSARVKVHVDSSDPIKDSVSSYLNRELRSLNDVELVDTTPEWEINVLAMEATNTKGYNMGVILSVVITKVINNQILYASHLLKVGSIDQLQKLCRDIIADFDTNQLEESRKSFRQPAGQPSPELKKFIEELW